MNPVMNMNIGKQVLRSFVFAGLIPTLMICVFSRAYTQNGRTGTVSKNSVSNHEITVLDDGETKRMDLEKYVTRVVLGEMSESFHQDALKAQAVAARTYTLYCIEVMKKHETGAVCTDYHCCQAYCEPEEYLNKRGTQLGIERITDAVKSTAGEVLQYNDELICATYFASSGGRTESPAELWGQSYPYLMAIDSPGEENCGYFHDEISLTALEFQDTIGVQLSGSPSSWFGMVKYTVGNGVDLMRIGGRLYTGPELRKIFQLRSTIISVTTTDDMITFKTKGYGHRVGLSQHGANALANNGRDYRYILQFYYPNAILKH